MSALAATGAGAEAEADAGADASRARHAPRVPRAPEGGLAAADHQLPDINLNNNPVLHQAAGHSFSAAIGADMQAEESDRTQGDTDQAEQTRAPQTNDEEAILMQIDEAATRHLPLHKRRAQDGPEQEGAADDAGPRPQRPHAVPLQPRERQTLHPPPRRPPLPAGN